MKHQGPPGGPPSADRVTFLRGAGGKLAFELCRTPAGLFVERTQAASLGERFIQALSLPDEETFIHWCDTDPGRFEDPLLLATVRRSGRELFQRSPLDEDTQVRLPFG